MSYQQGKLFPQAERLKLRQARVERLGKPYWDRLWRKGYDPSYILKVEPDDIPSLVEVWRTRVIYHEDSDKQENETYPVKVVVLSKGVEDQNRRIVAKGEGGWLAGLFIALLQRQVRDGTMRTQGVCYAMLTTLECDEGWQFIVDRWTDDLLTKRQI